MQNAQIDENANDANPTASPISQRPLRVWPGVVIAVLQLLVIFVVPIIKPEFAAFGILGGAAGGLLVLLWWLFFSRAPWLERLAAIVLMVVAVVVTKRIVHASIAGGMMGMMLPVFSIPVLSLTLVAAAVVTRRLSRGARRGLIAAAILLACGAFTLIRTGGISGSAVSDLHFRWTRTPEERLLAQAADEPTIPPSAPATAATSGAQDGADQGWPGFRGPKRDGVIHGVRIETDWSQKPPVPLWRRPIGPGWSSFAVKDNLLYTQEQRGDNEVVSCYLLATGQPVWKHSDTARFYESNAGPGPRGTPTLSNGRVYTFGGTGILNALDARTGSVFWSRNAATDTKAKTPGWGFASSPLVVGDTVIVAAAGSLAGYDVATGNPKWFGPSGGSGYSSPHLLTIDGVTQVLQLNGAGVISVAPADGALLWQHAWSSDGIVQPAVTADGDILLGSGSGFGAEVGVRRLAVAHGPAGWTTTERWTSTDLTPYFNDFVAHKESVFGFDGSGITCIDLKKGERKWHGGHYGNGQFVLLADQDLLLVVTEKGELALVKATSDQFTELARFKALEGKTWNHPVLVHDILLLRNGEEMVAFRLSLASS